MAIYMSCKRMSFIQCMYVIFTPLLDNNDLLMVNLHGNFQKANRRTRLLVSLS